LLQLISIEIAEQLTETRPNVTAYGAWAAKMAPSGVPDPPRVSSREHYNIMQLNMTFMKEDSKPDNGVL
jgi:hypothetical protein